MAQRSLGREGGERGHGILSFSFLVGDCTRCREQAQWNAFLPRKNSLWAGLAFPMGGRSHLYTHSSSVFIYWLSRRLDPST